MSDIGHLDFETYCELDIRKVGGHRYARHPSCEVLVARFTLPGDTYPEEWLPWQNPIPSRLARYVRSGGKIGAHNASFERSVWKWCLQRLYGDVPPVFDTQWVCTAAKAAACGLPRSLEKALLACGSGIRKDTEGSALIKVFCKPRKPTKADSRVRIRPQDDPVRFKRFSLYCARDVIGEMELDEVLPDLIPRQRRMFLLDLAMNDRGLPIDIPMVRKALNVVKALEEDIRRRVAALSGGIKATQVAKMLALFQERGLDIENMQAATVREALKDKTLDKTTRTLLQLRVEAGKASTKKLVSMLACADPEDWIVQGGFLIYGAHTGRYAGRLVQPQNFIRGLLKDHQRRLVFELLEFEDPELFMLLYDWPINTISQCMRGFIRAPKGYELAVVDYTAIEARVLAWLCGEEGMLKAYFANVDVYKLFAMKIYKLSRIEDVTDEQRRIAKNAVLGCGYQLGAERFVEYCAKNEIVITLEFSKKVISAYRDSVPAIKRAWKYVEKLVAGAITHPDLVYEGLKCKFYMEDHWLCVELPSGRCIRYPYARALPTTRWGKPAWNISFKTDVKSMFLRETTYGGKLLENIVQGIAFDIMQEGMYQAETNGYPVHGTVHDELLTLRRKGTTNMPHLEKLVCKKRPWMEGIPLSAKGFVCDRYQKG